MLHYDRILSFRLAKYRLFITYSPYAEREVNVDFDVLLCHGRLFIMRNSNVGAKSFKIACSPNLSIYFLLFYNGIPEYDNGAFGFF